MSLIEGSPDGRGLRLQKNMTENTINDDQSVYEIGYLIASIPDENIPAEAESLKKIIEGAGASVIAEDVPHRQQLAYTIRRKMVSGGYEKYDSAYFGWIKFEIGSDKVEAIKKAIELRPSVVRVLLISTVRENTYLGKRAPAMTANIAALVPAEAMIEDKKDIVPASIEEMDKSIDNMVKEAV